MATAPQGVENPERFASEIADCLKQSGRPIAFLIGAGCSAALRDAAGEPLIPDASGLTQAVAGALEGTVEKESWDRVVATLSEDGNETPNIEDVLSRVRGLLEHAGKGEVRGLSASQLDSLESLVCKEIITNVRAVLPSTETPFHALARWVGSTGRPTPVEIFTTNYDLLLEEALEQTRTPYFDGFAGGRRPLFDLYEVEHDHLPPRWARLWKVHGSINWRRLETATGFEICRGEVGDSAVIHPSHLKYNESRKLPYLAMVDRMRAFLAKPSSVLITCGYSFGDQHLNDVVAQGLRGNSSAVVLGLDYGDLPSDGPVHSIGRDCSNFRLHARNGALIAGAQIRWTELRDEPPSLSSSGVEWKEPAAEGGSWTADFLLGDFLRLGELLWEIVGPARVPTHSPDDGLAGNSHDPDASGNA